MAPIGLWLDRYRFPELVKELWRERRKGKTEAEILARMANRYAEPEILGALRWMDRLPSLVEPSRRRRMLELVLWLLLLLHGLFFYRVSSAASPSGLDEDVGLGLTIALLALALIFLYWQPTLGYLTIAFVLLFGLFGSPVDIGGLFTLPLDLLPWLRDWMLLILFLGACVDALLLQWLFGGPLRVRSILKKARMLKG